ncbi:MAG: bifunctional 3-deoxy-7-phosphoheptulonate synthase/chorismate mutase [Ignavibacteriaceae bacterium]|nr:bifunctional 3-deoxy-7-phosphoheptulonate synthase/chorismate mutase [Ignavibacteriaceae bacterium]
MKELREKINILDKQIIGLLAERRKLSRQVIELKDEKKAPIRDKEREKEILQSVLKTAKDYGLDSHYVTKLFNTIIEDSVRLQQNQVLKTTNFENTASIKIAIQGIEGSYSYLSAKQYFNDYGDLEFVKKKTFEEVVKSVENEEADFAVLPIENTTSGSINEAYDALMDSSLFVVGEEIYQVKHCLVSKNEIPLSKIQKIYAHPQAAVQCSKFLSKLTDIEVEYFADTAMSVQKISESESSDTAAIGSEEAARIFNVTVLREEIANQSGNYTRFLICSKRPIEVDLRIPSKTSLVFATAHSAGSLVDALLIFQKYKINMTKLQSRPIIGNPWEEMFYLDFQGNTADSNVKSLLEEFGKHTRFFRVLGCFASKEIEVAKIDVKDIEDLPTPTINITSELPKVKTESKSASVSYKLASRNYKVEDTVIKVGDVLIGGNNFIVMAGPCSVESKEMILECAKEVRDNHAQILRGGCFKPRTSPYSFQGMGFEGLEYLKLAGESYELPIITEVLSTEQVDEVARYSDILQIGARNMQNFPLLTAVGKINKPVMLKRSMMASLDELLNSAEYILAQGNRQVILCERGIRTFETATRNTLDLSSVLVLKELTHLPVVVDPSHAVGQRDKVIPLAKAAKVVGAHGIMVEFHPEPEKALSDGPQALYFNQFRELMKNINRL